MGAYFDALDTGRFAQFFTDDVTWTTTADHHRTQGPEAVQDAINALHARLPDMQTVQVVSAPMRHTSKAARLTSVDEAASSIASPTTSSTAA